MQKLHCIWLCRVGSEPVTGDGYIETMAPKQIRKPPGIVETAFKSLRNLGYTSMALASVLGVLVLLGQISRSIPEKSPPSPVAKKHR